MRVVVIEDELPSANHLIDMLATVAPAAHVVAQLASVAAAEAWLSDHAAPDLIFADIELQDGRVFDAFRTARSVGPVIFTTAYDRFLLDAFRAQGIAYLLKPFGPAELAGALHKYDELRRGFARLDGAQLDGLVRQLAAEPAAQRRHFTVKAKQRIRILPLERVALVMLGTAGIEIIDTQGASHYPSSETSLLEIERSVPSTKFFRINRTELLALDAIDHLEPEHDRITVAVRGLDRRLAVSVHRTAAFRRWIGLA